MPAPLDCFAVLTISYNYFATNFPITITTNNPCHLWLRWSVTVPQKHINPIIVRGAPIGTYIDQCFVAFHDIEQSEPGDRWTHTFYSPAWPACQRRWFYFHGTVGGIVSPSASPIFTKHRPWTTTHYSDINTGATTCDATITNSPCWLLWPDFITSTGTGSYPTAATLSIMLYAHTTPDRWRGLRRSIMTFDLTDIPGTHKVLAAAFYLKLASKRDTHGDKPHIAVFAATPGAMNNIVPADLTNIGATPLTNQIGYDAFGAGPHNEFLFSIPGLAALKPGRLNAIAIRESKFDATGISPPWVSSKQMYFITYSVDAPSSTYRPYLKVAHAPLGV